MANGFNLLQIKGKRTKKVAEILCARSNGSCDGLFAGCLGEHSNTFYRRVSNYYHYVETRG